jgi:hypothetical protein
VSSTLGNSYPLLPSARNTWECLGMLLVITHGGSRGLLPASSGQRPGVLLNTLQCSHQKSPSQQRVTQPQGHSCWAWEIQGTWSKQRTLKTKNSGSYLPDFSLPGVWWTGTRGGTIKGYLSLLRADRAARRCVSYRRYGVCPGLSPWRRSALLLHPPTEFLQLRAQSSSHAASATCLPTHA